MFERGSGWVEREVIAPPLGPLTQQEIDLVAALDAAETAALNAQGAPWLDDGHPDPDTCNPPPQPDPHEPTAEHLAEYLAEHPTGPALARTLHGTDPDDLDDYTTVELIAAWSRLTAWAQAGTARAAAALAQRPSMTITACPPPPPPRHHSHRPRLSGAAAHEIAMRLTITPTTAHHLITTGTAIETTLTGVGDALAAGLIDLPKTHAFTDALTGTPLPLALAVQDTVLPDAPRRTLRQLRHDIARALITTDPTEATRRHRSATTRRHVTHPTPLPDGMAGIWAVLPAPDATALDIALEAAARTHTTTTNDPRTHDQLRADILATLAHTALTQGWIGPTPPQAAPRQAPPGNPRPQARTRETAPAGPGQTSPDQTAPDPATPGPGQSGPGEIPPDQVDPPPGYRLGQIGGRPAQIRVTIPLAVLLPPDTNTTPDGTPAPGEAARPTTPASGAVAELEGYGPITDDVARALALGGTWKRLITDPHSGTIRDVGRTRYKPPPDLADLIRARDTTCIRPGCPTPAQHCDLDHTIPYHLGGHTTETNLAALCPTDHTLKTRGTYHIDQPEPGTFTFTTPTGHTYRRNPDGTSHQLPRHHNHQPNNEPPPF